ncbi:amidase [Alteromonas aestuariivivens]|uniref:Amidase n=1 Tax=Alteromonas aestuariivivens TaxID=1938339 RepID=A0A3D8MB71_9ALTE|nr:amidase [Alteromonas aestuariivivens]RDV27522.1 amidase [Alteromonas aestuariivivens]
MKTTVQPNPFILVTPPNPENGASSLPLSGMRLAVKDLFHIEGLETTAGNPDWARTHPLPTHTASAVARLLERGAHVVGKTVTDELAYSLNGQNVHYGTPVNPITPDRLPGGSSSGSAVAVAADLADIGLGTDTGGSIRVPASYNGLFGLRPTHGAIGCDNMVALAPSFDTVGWMTRDLDTLVKVAEAMFNGSLPRFHQPRLGVLTSLLNHAQHREQIETWLQADSVRDAFESITALSTDWGPVPPGELFRVLQGAEIWQQHGEWISATQPAIAADIRSRLDWCKTITDQQVELAKAGQGTVIKQLDALFGQADILLLPTTPGLAPKLDEAPKNLVSYRNHLLNFTALAGLGGLPQLHLPVFSVSGAPCGVSLLGKKGSDLALLAVATQILEFEL